MHQHYHELFLSLPNFFSLYLYAFLSFFKKSLLATTKIYDMLILKLKTTKQSHQIYLSAYHLNCDNVYSQCRGYLKNIGNCQQTFYVIIKS